MNFKDLLRQSRTSRVAVLHEFWTQYNPNQPRIHAFFEGHDDVAFFSHFIERYAPKDARLYVYRCEGKARVFEAFSQITSRAPAVRSVFFFVDKDLDDIVGTAWPTDPRIFVTDVYSIENYIVSRLVLQRLIRDAVRLVGVTFDEAVVLEQFDRELEKFHRRMLPLMAWVLLARRRGDRPNIANVDISAFYVVDESCELKRVSHPLLEALSRITGLHPSNPGFRHLAAATRELARIPPKRVIRGKFEAWFFVQFWKSLLAQLRTLSREVGGNMSVKLTLEHSSFCASLKTYLDPPRALELFLSAHFSQVSPARGIQRENWLRRIVRALTR